MATPFANSIPITDLRLVGLSYEEAGLIDGTKWGGGYGTGVTLTYSFPLTAGPEWHAADYSAEEWPGAFGLNANEQDAVRRVLGGVSRGADISFALVPDDFATVGELRFTRSTSISSYAHAYLPYGEFPDSGDAWFSGGWNEGGGAVIEGSYEFMTIVHEVGHALGLKHSFERGYSGVALEPEHDNYLWTVMSYSAYAGAGGSVWADFYPTTMMYLDLVALEKLYGPSLNANPGNTTYAYREYETYWETIADSGGNDTIVYEASSKGGYIDLSNAEFSRMGRAVHFSDGTQTRDTIGLGPSTLIENAVGGGGHDTVIGNFAANRLIGSGGNDTLIGNGGADLLNGGAGRDWVGGGPGNDILVWKPHDTYDGGGGNRDSLWCASGSLDLTRISNIRFRDIEMIDLSGSGDTRLTLKRSDVLDLSSTSQTLRVLGEAGDVLDFEGALGSGTLVSGGAFVSYKVGAGTLLVDKDVDVV